MASTFQLLERAHERIVGASRPSDLGILHKSGRGIVFDLSASALAAQVFTGLVLGGIFVLLAIGLSLIFGLMTVVNFAHGSLYMLGAYFGVFLLGLTSDFWVSMVAAPLMVFVLGLVIERVLVRPLYGRWIDDPLLLTCGLALVVVDAVRSVWGKIRLTIDPPRALRGAVGLGFITFPLDRA